MKIIDSFLVSLKEARHSRTQCMHCDHTPEYVCIWANGHGRAWFCEECFKKWLSEDDREVDYLKKVKDGEVKKEWKENTNPNIWERFKKDKLYESVSVEKMLICLKEQEAQKLTNERAQLRNADSENEGERCSFCRFFIDPESCKIVEGPISSDLVCDWIQSRDTDAPQYSVTDEDFIAFGLGMIDQQPYQHVVRDVANTPEGPMVMIEDTVKPRPHRFSLSKEFHVEHTSFEHHWTQEEVDKLVVIGNVILDESLMIDLTEAMRPAFGSPGGKKLLASTVVSYIPKHKIYVEPFIGGAAVLFKKEPSEIEAINDKDPEISFAYKFIKEGKFDGLKNLKIDGSREYFDKLKTSSIPSEPAKKFHRFLYLLHFSFGNARQNYAQSIEDTGRTLSNRFNALPKIQERLKSVKMRGGDYKKLLTEFDSKDTFFYLDPPYPEQQGKLKTDLTTSDIENSLKGLKGKWMLSLPYKPDAIKLAAKHHSKIVTLRRTLNMKSAHVDKELIIANFPLKKENIYLKESQRLEQLIPELRESLRTGKQDYKPEDFAEGTKELYMKAFDGIIKKYICLDESQANMIYEGKKVAVVKPLKFIAGSFLSLVCENKEYGFIRLSDPRVITLKEFEELREEHRISDEDRQKWAENQSGWDKGPLYFYPVREFISFEKPRSIALPEGIQIFGWRERLERLDNKNEEAANKSKPDEIDESCENKINEAEYLNAEALDYPLEIRSDDRIYYLIKTAAGKLVLNKKA